LWGGPASLAISKMESPRRAGRAEARQDDKRLKQPAKPAVVNGVLSEGNTNAELGSSRAETVIGNTAAGLKAALRPVAKTFERDDPLRRAKSRQQEQ
jgi:hypothetical protein